MFAYAIVPCAAAGGALNHRVEESSFRLLTPIEDLTVYQWHTRTAKDYFCAVCGVLPFRRPPTAPELWTINVRCLEGVDLESIPVRRLQGSRPTVTSMPPNKALQLTAKGLVPIDLW